MSTGQLHRGTGRLRKPTRANDRKPMPGGLAQAPVPPFHIIYPNPPGYGKNHPFYAMHRAANRVYTDRLKFYKKQARELSPPQLVDFVREDIVSNLLAVERIGLGPLSVDRYVFLKGPGLHAWFPPHRQRAEAMLMDFCRHFKKKKERVSATANNNTWGRPQGAT